MRVALFGGSFDPPHHGHIAIAIAAADVFDLDQVLFAPVGRQPLKAEGRSAPFADRLAMVQLACGANPRFVASDLDAPRTDGAPNYTVQTLTTLHETMPDVRLFNLVGADSFLTLPRWHDAPRLLQLAEWIVVSRPEFPLTPAFLDQPELAENALLEIGDDLVGNPAVYVSVFVHVTVLVSLDEKQRNCLPGRASDGDGRGKQASRGSKTKRN